MIEHEIVVGVTGGIAAYKTADMVSALVQSGLGVTVVLTETATRFVGQSTFAALTGRPVVSHAFESSRYPLGAHIELARDKKLLCIAPATADFLSKLAHGVADDVLSTLCLCFTGPILVAPAMNHEMWAKPSVQRNMRQVRADGVFSIGPDEGWLSCREKGVGRMSPPAHIIAEIERILQLPAS